MKLLNLEQGTPEWIAARLEHFTASEAPAMMNASKYMSRTELLTLKKTGVSKPIDKFTQSIFDKGHAAEESARSIIEFDYLEELLPAVAAREVDGLKLLASFDGITEDHKLVWEHKLFNKTLAENVQNEVLEPNYFWQLEHQLLVARAKEALFTCSDGTEDKINSMYYKSLPERREALIAGWKQFAIDLSVHEVEAKEEKLVANEIAELPKLEISLVGNVNSSNLAEYKGTALAFIQSINTDLKNDQDFVNAEKAVKFCQQGEKELEAVKDAALSDTADIKALFDTIDELKEEMRQKRLTLDKLVKTRKVEIKNEINAKAHNELDTMVNALRSELNGVSIKHTANFVIATKNKRTLESLHDAVNGELARCKIELNEKAALIRENLKQLHTMANNHQFLFSDWQGLVTEKATDDLVNLIKSRITDHETTEAEHKRVEQARIEAAAKVNAEREAAAKLEAQAQAIRDEEREKIEAEQKAAAAKLAKEQAEAAQDEAKEAPAIGNHAVNNQGSAKEVEQRLAERFKETRTSVDKEVAPIQNVKTPNADDIAAFLTLESTNKESINNFGYLLLSGDSQHEAEALRNIKIAFQKYMQQEAA